MKNPALKKEELQPIRSSKTGHETVVTKKAFDENKALYAPYVAIKWEEMKSFELVEKAESAKATSAKEKKVDKVESSSKVTPSTN